MNFLISIFIQVKNTELKLLVKMVCVDQKILTFLKLAIIFVEKEIAIILVSLNHKSYLMLLLATFGEDLFALFIITCIYLQRNKKVEVEIAKIQTHQKLVVQIILTTANTSTWQQIAKKHVEIVKEEEEIAKIRMLNVQPGLPMGIAKNTRITCKKNAQKLAKFAEKN